MADPTGPGVVEGTANNDTIDAGYTDADGDSISNLGDLVYGNDGDDLINGGGGSDTIDGGAGNDTIYGGDDGTGPVVTGRESFNWSLLPGSKASHEIHDGQTLDPLYTQDTGTVDVTYTQVSSSGVYTKYETDNQNIDNIDGGSETVNDNSSLESKTDHDGENATYRLDFSDPVANVDFRINDIDHDSVVQVLAYDADGNQIPVTFTASAGTDLSLTDEDSIAGVDTASATGNSGSNSADDNSILVEVAGPVARIEIIHSNDGGDGSDVNVSDVFFDTLSVGAYEDLSADSLMGGIGDDVIYGQGGDDTIYGGDGDDTIDGGDGNDTIYGDGGNSGSTREIFEWSEGPGFANNANAGDFTQDTGNASITFTTVSQSAGVETEYETSTQNTDNLDAAVDENASLSSILNGDPNSATYSWESDVPVENVELRINDIDGDGRVVVRAYDENGDPIEVTLSDAGSSLTLSDSDSVAGNDTAACNDNSYANDDSAEHSVLVSIAGPVSRWEIVHEQDGSHNTGINVTDIAFDVPAVATGEGNDLLIGGEGDDDIYGMGGNDTLQGDEGSNYLSGGTGDDVFIGGDGADTFQGNAGQDNIDYSNSGAAVNVDLDTSTLSGGDADNDSIEGGIDGVIGSEFDDTLTGFDQQGTDPSDTFTNQFWGNGGNDTITGKGGDDYIDGGDDDDSIMGGAGADTLIGGTGDDNIDLGGADGAADTATGGDDQDTFTGIGQGDVIDGSEGGTDYDTLNLDGAADAVNPGGSYSVEYSILNPENGVVHFYDAGGVETGTAQFFNIENVICFTPGTAILTPSGEVAVEDLKVGDKVVTRDNGLQTIRWAGRKKLTGRDLLSRPKLRPIMIRKDSLGENLPDRDMMVSPNHRMLLVSQQAQLLFEETEVLIAAKHLVHVEGVQQIDTVGVEYVHFLCDNHEVVLANGAWSESFQPGEFSMGGIESTQREEIYDLFPELRKEEALENFSAARMTLKRHEAKLIG